MPSPPSECAACYQPAVWQFRVTGELLCDEHAAELDLDDLRDLWSIDA